MKELRHRQTGLSIFKALVAIVAIGSLAATGWTIYQHNRNQVAVTTAAISTQSRNQQTTEQPTANTKSAPTVTYLHIKEWKVQLALDSSTASLYYYIKPDLPNVAYLSLKTVSDIAPDCAANKVSLGAIFRESAAEHQNAIDNPSALNQAGTLHIGNYWYGYAKPNAGCIYSAATLQAVAKVQPNISPSGAFKTLEDEQ